MRQGTHRVTVKPWMMPRTRHTKSERLKRQPSNPIPQITNRWILYHMHRDVSDYARSYSTGMNTSLYTYFLNWYVVAVCDLLVQLFDVCEPRDNPCWAAVGLLAVKHQPGSVRLCWRHRWLWSMTDCRTTVRFGCWRSIIVVWACRLTAATMLCGIRDVFVALILPFE